MVVKCLPIMPEVAKHECNTWYSLDSLKNTFVLKLFCMETIWEQVCHVNNLREFFKELVSRLTKNDKEHCFQLSIPA